MKGAEVRARVAPLEGGQAEIDVGQSDGCGDASRGHFGEFGLPALVHVIHGGIDALFGAGHPFRPLQSLRPHGGFIAIAHTYLGQTLSQGLQGENAEALDAVIGDQRLVACDMGQIFNDDAAVIDRRTCFRDRLVWCLAC